ncbi:XdhC family protein [Polaribacter sp.]|uniref:XdhC family protein n=1 Tax=Polaribacter sp. TaxID=1920175 RepID=UPI003EF78E1C
MIIWQHILSKLKENTTVYLLVVVQNTGSSPGRKGFKMLVSKDGFIFGSIGGGVMEFSLVEQAKKLLQEENTPIFIKKQIHKGHVKNGSGMICSGEQTVAFYPMVKRHISMVNNVVNCLENNLNGVLQLTPTSISFADKKMDSQFNYQLNSENEWYFKEQLNFKETLYIIGGGHVSVAVSELLVNLGFYVIIIDNRKNLNTLENNNFPHKKLIINYKDIHNSIDEGLNTYVVIMTHKYTEDKLILSKLLKNNYKFMGVLGSKAKLATMWKVLLDEGFTPHELNKIHAPIGLSIKSETPLEIAVSIAAQIIKCRNSEK